MRAQTVHESPRRGIARRVGAAGMAVAAALTLGACDEARGGGYIGAPAPGSPTNLVERANFGFNFTCDAERVKGQITYHDPSDFLTFSEVRIHGTVEKVVIELVPDNPLTPEDEQVVGPAARCVDVEDAPAAIFMGTYRSQDSTITGRGKFTVQVRDQGEPSRPRDFNGDGFSIDLIGPPDQLPGPYGAYFRAGNIEGGNIQVE